MVSVEDYIKPSAIPGPVPDEILVPVTSSIDVRREARKALLAFSGNDIEKVAQTDIASSNAGEPTQMGDDTLFSSKTTPGYVINPKQDLYGLGFDPFKHAPEFRDRKASMARNDHLGSKRVNSMIGNLFGSNSGKYAPGFGIGALEELDVEDEDIYASGLELAGNEVQEDDISRIVVDGKLRLGNSQKGILHGFKVALKSDYSLERFDPPNIPPDYTPHHKFSSPLETVDKLLEPAPPEVPPPDDDNLRLLIDGFANLVSRCGKLFEDLSKKKSIDRILCFRFLMEKHIVMESIPPDQRMTAENRGKLLGEKPLERSSNTSLKSSSLNEVVQFPTNLSDTFTKATKFLGPTELIKPFGDDPFKQKRFELFLKEKYEGGLRSSSFSGASKMSESERARERLDFEAAAEAIAKFEQSAKDSLQKKQKSTEFSIIGDEHFVSSSGGQISKDEDKLVGKVLPTREEFQWRPSPLLCKRFDILDPYMGKPPPIPRPRSKMDALIFMVDSNLDSKKEAIPSSIRDQSSISAPKDSLTTALLEAEKANKPAAEQAEAALSLYMQKPVDLYKAIFSDDSEDEDDSSFNEVAKLDKTSEVTNTTLNSLIAGDFLESLGKELGLEVPKRSQGRPCL
ncbi:hypothetical protein HPP92_003115 [Vanilla planifolia]|uniref:Uncharacterized protein n=1 Tax=Vanilla planifolia TaxID=51239 RepID=A0A835RUK7_VANPL|nr:hypothetical protein HPP92_003115 [Vanilla planifolia]